MTCGVAEYFPVTQFGEGVTMPLCLHFQHFRLNLTQNSLYFGQSMQFSGGMGKIEFP